MGIYNIFGAEISGSSVPGNINAAGDGVTDDTEALTKALNQSNAVVDGGNKKYKYMSITMTGVENLTVKNVIFWKGQSLEVAGCKNIRFENCIWEGINCNGNDTIWTCGIRLRERKDANGNEIWCENIWIDHCIFDDIWYNTLLDHSMPHSVSGQAIVPRSVHNLYIKHNFFTQTKGNAAIHWNTYKKCGYAEITDNTFYLTGVGGICVYAVQQAFPKVRGKLSNNQFIGCGLGYMPPEFLNKFPENQRGLGCAAILGGAGTRACPYKWHFVCENNTFEDCVESSIEGPVWNPCIGNSITGQGAIQTDENCRKMEEKYHLDYTLQKRIINSVNFIYRNYYRDVDGTFPNEDDDPIVFQNNTMGISYVSRASYIQFKGEYNVPLIFTNNTMRVGLTQGLDTHFLGCQFKAGIRFENNDGIYPYFNGCTFEGDVVLDDILSAYKCDFSKANLITNQSRGRFPETHFSIYDPSQAVFENDQVTREDGYAVLTSYDIPEKIKIPDDTAYNIQAEKEYVAGDGYIFPGPASHKHIDTGVQLLKDDGDWTIFLKFTGNETTEIPSSKSGIMALCTVYDAETGENRLLTGGQWSNVATVVKPNKNVVSLDTKTKYTLRDLKLLMRKVGEKIEIWLARQDTDASSLSENLTTYEIQEGDSLDGFSGNLYIGVQENYNESDMYSLYGKMEEFEVFQRSLSDAEVGMFLYGKVLGTSESTEEAVPVYNIATDSHYSTDERAVVFDGTFGIDTGLQLFADNSDFTIICEFKFDSYHDEGLANFNFIPVLSSMNYTEDKKKSPGFDIGLFLAAGNDPETIPTGGFVNFRNSWKFANSATLVNSYFGYHNNNIGIICIRKDGAISVYDYNMQRLATLTGTDATTVFSGTLHIGENMVVPTLGENNKLKGKVYECRVYKEALSTSVLENMFPNIYSNEKRTKGTLCCYVPNQRYKNALIRYIYLEALIDMGEHGTPEYAQKYPKAVGIKIDGIGDVMWVGTGSNGHIKTWIYNNKTIKPYRNIAVRIVNTGLCPNLKAKVQAFRCAILTEESDVTESVDALDFSVEWEKEDLSLSVGQALSGYVSYLPEDSNSGTTLELSTSEGITATLEENLLTVTGVAEGEATLEATLPSGIQKIYTFQISGA
ncbi:hypothetical protein [Brotaphodocola sp.]|uniref:hypothetical protein n=1 Tax=Brotaphodocola sp. TaxID=3073577 RepID=UPI003D7D704A